jgi:N-acetylglucosaminyldiphosphoundecaprenol N-acetyl-beta-D-mannosaminyltransferase
MALLDFNISNSVLPTFTAGKVLITTLNVHSYNVTRNDVFFEEALKNSHILLPDGIGVVWGIRWLTGKKIKKIAGYDFFIAEMERMQATCGKIFFLGSSGATLDLIRARAAGEYPEVAVDAYSPPFRDEFTEDELPDKIMELRKFDFEIKWCDEKLKSYTKLIPSFTEFLIVL